MQLADKVADVPEEVWSQLVFKEGLEGWYQCYRLLPEILLFCESWLESLQGHRWLESLSHSESVHISSLFLLLAHIRSLAFFQAGIDFSCLVSSLDLQPLLLKARLFVASHK